MHTLIGWRVYYDNGVVISSKEMKWEEIPADGIQCVVEFYDDGTRKLHLERDYYILDEGKAYGTNNIHPYLHKIGSVKFGRWASDGFFADIVKKAKEEPL